MRGEAMAEAFAQNFGARIPDLTLEQRIAKYLGTVDGDTNFIIHRAVAHNDIEVLEYMLRLGADPDALYLENTALHYSVLHHRVECCEILLRNGANPVIKNSVGNLPIDILLSTSGIEETVEKIKQLLRTYSFNKKEIL